MKGKLLAESTDKPNTPNTTAPSGQPQEQGQRSLSLNTSNTKTTYANFCRVAGAPEETIVDFGLNTQSNAEGPRTIIVDQRIVMNYYTAKRLAHVLRLSIEQHERAFGAVETDVSKRVVNRPARPS